MNLIVKMQFGSHVYGTNLPSSDHDYKGIYLPSSKDIILQRVKKNYTLKTKEDDTKKNGPDDVDFEVFSLQEYLKLLMEGQTVAVDMLFIPDQFLMPLFDGGLPACKGAWMDILLHKDKFIHKGTTSYVGYCRTQAAKYGLKGGRVATIKTAINFLSSLPGDDKLDKHWETIFFLARDTEHMSIDLIDGPNGQTLPYWNVCDRKVGTTVSVQYALDIFNKIYDNYGHRAKLAEKNEGIDWKALMHAVRVCEEAIELLTTGHITFPRPEKELLLKIRKAELSYAKVAEIIEEGLLRVEEAKEKSTLREEPDRDFAETLVYNHYGEIIKNELV